MFNSDTYRKLLSPHFDISVLKHFKGASGTVTDGQYQCICEEFPVFADYSDLTVFPSDVSHLCIEMIDSPSSGYVLADILKNVYEIIGTDMRMSQICYLFRSTELMKQLQNLLDVR